MENVWRIPGEKRSSCVLGKRESCTVLRSFPQRERSTSERNVQCAMGGNSEASRDRRPRYLYTTHTHTQRTYRATRVLTAEQSRRREASWQRSYDRRLAKATVNAHRQLYMWLRVCAWVCVCVCVYIERYMAGWSYNDDSCRPSAAPSAHCTVNLSVSRSLPLCVRVCENVVWKWGVAV